MSKNDTIEAIKTEAGFARVALEHFRSMSPNQKADALARLLELISTPKVQALNYGTLAGH